MEVLFFIFFFFLSLVTIVSFSSFSDFNRYPNSYTFARLNLSFKNKKRSTIGSIWFPLPNAYIQNLEGPYKPLCSNLCVRHCVVLGF